MRYRISTVNGVRVAIVDFVCARCRLMIILNRCILEGDRKFYRNYEIS